MTVTTETPYRIPGTRLSELRNAARRGDDERWTQKALGREIGMTYATLIDIEAGRCRPRDSQLASACRKLRVSADDKAWLLDAYTKSEAAKALVASYNGQRIVDTIRHEADKHDGRIDPLKIAGISGQNLQDVDLACYALDNACELVRDGDMYRHIPLDTSTPFRVPGAQLAALWRAHPKAKSIAARDENTLADIERGRKRLRPQELKAVCKALPLVGRDEQERLGIAYSNCGSAKAFANTPSGRRVIDMVRRQGRKCDNKHVDPSTISKGMQCTLEDITLACYALENAGELCAHESHYVFVDPS